MKTEQSLISAVARDPQNADLRLVCADYFEDIGDSRCEVIRMWHDVIANRSRRADVESVEQKIEQITQRDQRRWNSGVHRYLHQCGISGRTGTRRSPLRNWQYSFGFIESIRVTEPFYRAHWELLLSLGPVRQLRLLVEDESQLRSIHSLPGLSDLDSLYVTASGHGMWREIHLAAQEWKRPNTELVLNGSAVLQERTLRETLLNAVQLLPQQRPLFADRSPINTLNRFDVWIGAHSRSGKHSVPHQRIVEPAAQVATYGTAESQITQAGVFVESVQQRPHTDFGESVSSQIQAGETSVGSQSLGQRLRTSVSNVIRFFSKNEG